MKRLSVLAYLLFVWCTFCAAQDINLVIYAEVTTPNEPASQVHLYWNDIQGASGYKLQRKTYFNDTFAVLTTVIDTQYVDSNIDTCRYYRIIATDSIGEPIDTSTVVGYIKIPIKGNVNQVLTTNFSYPGFRYFNVPSSNIPEYNVLHDSITTDIIDEQAKCGFAAYAHRVYNAGTIVGAYRSGTNCTWNTDFHKIYLDHGAAYANRYGAERYLILAGEVLQLDEFAYGYSCSLTVQVPSLNGSYVSFPILEWVETKNLGLLDDGFEGGNSLLTSDQLWEIESDSIGWFDTGINEWRGLTYVKPGTLYFIKNISGSYWYYTWP